jgi:diacylglycerol kinase (ATP)
MKHLSHPTSAPHTATRFSWRSRLRSFSHAFNGMALLIQTQHNAWLHLLATLMVAATAWHLGVSAADWRWLLTAITLVWAAEAMNTAIEFVCDVVSAQYSFAVKSAKDIAAGAVLITAAGAAAIGLMAFWPYLSKQIEHLH